MMDKNAQFDSSVSPFKGSFRLFFLGSISLLGYIYLFLLSGEDLFPRSSDPWHITRFLQTYAILFACYWFLISPLVHGKRMDPRHLWFAIAFGLLFRAVMLPSDLILENDIYRYLWDGHTTLEGISPYQHAPLDPATGSYRTDYWSKINYPNYPTIYPPTLQIVFTLSELIYPGSVTGMKFILLLFDVGTIFLLLALLQAIDLPPEWCLIYAWSPLVVKEIANSGHADAISAFLLVLLMLLVVKKNWGRSSITLAFLTLTKFFGVFILPLFHVIWRWKHYGVFLLIIVLSYIPFLSYDANPFAGLMAYSKEWRFNAGIYELTESLLSKIGGEIEEKADVIARITLFSVILLITAWQTIAMTWRTGNKAIFRASYIIIGTLILCSPVIDPWYLIWVVPFLCIFPNRAWILFTGTVFLSYTFYYSYGFEPWVKWAQFGTFFLLLFLEKIFPKWRWGIGNPMESIQEKIPLTDGDISMASESTSESK